MAEKFSTACVGHTWSSALSLSLFVSDCPGPYPSSQGPGGPPEGIVSPERGRPQHGDAVCGVHPTGQLVCGAVQDRET